MTRTLLRTYYLVHPTYLWLNTKNLTLHNGCSWIATILPSLFGEKKEVVFILTLHLALCRSEPPYVLRRVSTGCIFCAVLQGGLALVVDIGSLGSRGLRSRQRHEQTRVSPAGVRNLYHSILRFLCCNTG